MASSAHGGFILLDAGASPDIDPSTSSSSRSWAALRAERPRRKHARVHLLNIGEEPGKGSAFAKAGYELLKDEPWFAGNIEGKTMFASRATSWCARGFVGNITLKTAEGVRRAHDEHHPRRRSEESGGAPAVLARQTGDGAAEEEDGLRPRWGGSPLLGLNGVCVIAHGRSNARAIENAVLLAQSALDADLLGTIRRAAAPNAGDGIGSDEIAPTASFGLPNAS